MGKILICPECGKTVVSKSGRKSIHDECRVNRDIRRKELMQHSMFTIFKRDDFKCAYCGKSPIEDHVKLVLDHVRSYSSTKNNSIYNLITCCEECNMHKGALNLDINVYKRIIQRNIERNKGISLETQAWLDEFFEEYYTEAKTGTVWPSSRLDKWQPQWEDCYATM